MQGDGVLLAKVIYFPDDETRKCPMCNWSTHTGIVVGATEEILDEKEKQGDFLCPDCFAQVLATWRVFAVGAAEVCPKTQKTEVKNVVQS